MSWFMGDGRLFSLFLKGVARLGATGGEAQALYPC